MTDARGSWLVKACRYTRMGCGRTSQRAAQGSLYRGAGRQRRSERLKVGPYAQGRWPCSFCGPQDRGDLRPAICVYFMSLSRRNAASESDERKTALSYTTTPSQIITLLFQMIFPQQLFLVFIVLQDAIDLFFPAFLYQLSEQYTECFSSCFFTTFLANLFSTPFNAFAQVTPF